MEAANQMDPPNCLAQRQTEMKQVWFYQLLAVGRPRPSYRHPFLSCSWFAAILPPNDANLRLREKEKLLIASQRR